MAQRNPTPITAAVAAADDDLAAVADIGFAPGRRHPSVPARTQVQFERQRIRQQFRKERAALAIVLSGELHDEAGEAVTQSLLYSNLLRRGLGDDLTDTQAAFFDESDRVLAAGALTIQTDAAQGLTDMAAKADLPEDAVTDWDTFCRWLANHERR